MSKRDKALAELRKWLGLSQDYVEKKRAPRVKRGVSVEQTSWLDNLKPAAPAILAAPAEPSERTSPEKACHDTMSDVFEIAEQENQRLRDQAARAIKRTFTPGTCYQVHRTKAKYRITTSKNDAENGYAFIYLRKEGIHHVFREAKDGWIRTYTDAQLVGKYVDEVEIQDVLIPVKGGYMYV